MGKVSIIIIMLVLQFFLLTSKVDTYYGYAYELESGKFIYKETHAEKFEKGKHIETLTKYLNSENVLIGERKLDFSKSQTKPDFITTDLRTGYKEGATVNGNTVRLFVKPSSKESLKEKTIIVPEPFAVDGGFNFFIKENWSALMEGKTIEFNFTVSSELTYFLLRARKEKEDLVKNEKVKIIVEPGNVVARWVTDPITITYNKTTKRIIVYEGKSNQSNNYGKNYNARLVYPSQGP